MWRIARRAISTSQLRPSPKLIVTDATSSRLAEICDEKEYLRVSVGGGGCSGYSYSFELTDEPIDEEEDLVFTHLNQRVGWFDLYGIKPSFLEASLKFASAVTDRESIEFMDGATIDFKTELIKRSFVVTDNPKADSGCSCGSSFSIDL